MTKKDKSSPSNTLDQARAELDADDAFSAEVEPGRVADAYDAMWESVDRIHTDQEAAPSSPLAELQKSPGSGQQARIDPSQLKNMVSDTSSGPKRAPAGAQPRLDLSQIEAAGTLPPPRVGELRASLADAVADSQELAQTPAELDAETAMKPNPLLDSEDPPGGARVVRDELREKAPAQTTEAIEMPDSESDDVATATFEHSLESKSPPDPARPLHLGKDGRISGRYLDQGELARGGFGAIHQVVDETLARRVAMKVIDVERAGREKDVYRFFEEAQITAQLDHPNIPPVHELGADDEGRQFFTMKLVRGRTLKEILKATDFEQRSPPELDRALQIMIKVCDALAFAHSKGVIHRDLKPDNIMVGSHGQVYLMDWGIAQLQGTQRPSQEEDAVALGGDVATGRQDEDGTIIGTPAYMAPEQANGDIDDIDERTDVFALGGILYNILTDEPPYRGADAVAKVIKAQKGRVMPPQERAPGWNLPAGLCHITMKALAREKSKRYQTVADLKDDIEQFLRGGFWFTEVNFKKGKVILQEGDDADAAYIITAGSCEAYKVDGDNEMVLRQMGPGDVFGETAILTGGQRTANVRAKSRVSAMVVTRQAMEAELSSDSWIGSLVGRLASRFREHDVFLMEALRIKTAQEIALAGLTRFHLSSRDNGSDGSMPLKPLLKGLKKEFSKSDDEIMAALNDCGPLVVDAQKGTVRLQSQRASSG